MEPSASPATSMQTVRHAKSCRVRATFLKKRCDSTATSRALELAYRLPVPGQICFEMNKIGDFHVNR
ncbi:hypothetical protein U9M48_017910 [Paspalum notatum var. saurae]|uniref:Uncharacterized protein n=1 Tax=Paspalum notatum var. saurae TaxID=547442 RepID=A0AAQ3T9Q0_PASNO